MIPNRAQRRAFKRRNKKTPPLPADDVLLAAMLRSPEGREILRKRLDELDRGKA